MDFGSASYTAKTLHKNARVLLCYIDFSSNILSNIACLPVSVHVLSQFQGYAWVLQSFNVLLCTCGRGKGHFVQVFWKNEVQKNVYAMWDG